MLPSTRRASSRLLQFHCKRKALPRQLIDAPRLPSRKKIRVGKGAGGGPSTFSVVHWVSSLIMLVIPLAFRRQIYWNQLIGVQGARCIAEVVYARMGEDGVPRWFKLADEHVHLLAGASSFQFCVPGVCDSKSMSTDGAVDATAWPIYRRYPTEQWNRGLVPDNVLFRGDPQQASAPANSRPSVSWSDVNWRYNGCGTAAAKAHR